MAGFLKEHPWISEWEYDWCLSVEKRTIYLIDAPSVDYKASKKDKKDEEIVGDLADVVAQGGSMSGLTGAKRRR